MTERSAGADNLVGGYTCAHAAAAHHYSAVHISASYSSSQGDGKIWIVVVGVVDFVTKILNFMSLLAGD